MPKNNPYALDHSSIGLMTSSGSPVCLAICRGWPRGLTIDKLDGSAPVGVPCELPIESEYTQRIFDGVVGSRLNKDFVVIISNAKIVHIDRPAACWYNGDLLFKNKTLDREAFGMDALLKLGLAFSLGRMTKE